MSGSSLTALLRSKWLRKSEACACTRVQGGHGVLARISAVKETGWIRGEKLRCFGGGGKDGDSLVLPDTRALDEAVEIVECRPRQHLNRRGSPSSICCHPPVSLPPPRLLLRPRSYPRSSPQVSAASTPAFQERAGQCALQPLLVIRTSAGASNSSISVGIPQPTEFMELYSSFNKCRTRC